MGPCLAGEQLLVAIVPVVEQQGDRLQIDPLVRLRAAKFWQIRDSITYRTMAQGARFGNHCGYSSGLTREEISQLLFAKI